MHAGRLAQSPAGRGAARPGGPDAGCAGRRAGLNLRAVAAFLFKTEPTSYSFADLARERRAVWDGVSNALALIHLRTVKRGDRVVIYHSGADRAAVGLAVATADAYPDPKLGDPRRVVVDLRPEHAFGQPIPLATLKTDPVLKTLELVRNTRLSVMPVSAAQLARLEKLGGR